MRNISLLITAVIFLISVSSSQASEPGIALTHVFDIHAKCDAARVSGSVAGGKRVVIPITGGNIEGKIEGMILPGGADYQMIDTVSGRTELDAIYTIMTNDSCFINVRNRGININDSNGYYFTTSPVFEAPKSSRYNWINNRIFVCKPIGFDNGVVHLRIWSVE